MRTWVCAPLPMIATRLLLTSRLSTRKPPALKRDTVPVPLASDSLAPRTKSAARPRLSKLSAGETGVRTGALVSTAKMPESVVPLPALPARSATPVLASVMVLFALSRSVPEVKVAVQVLPSSAEVRALSVPPWTMRSELSSPVIFSLKVSVTCAVSPAFRLDLETWIVAVGPVWSTVRADAILAGVADWRLPALSVCWTWTAPAA